MLNTLEQLNRYLNEPGDASLFRIFNNAIYKDNITLEECKNIKLQLFMESAIIGNEGYIIHFDFVMISNELYEIIKHIFDYKVPTTLEEYTSTKGFTYTKLPEVMTLLRNLKIDSVLNTKNKKNKIK